LADAVASAVLTAEFASERSMISLIERILRRVSL
jgi:hypothetical protein